MLGYIDLTVYALSISSVMEHANSFSFKEETSCQEADKWNEKVNSFLMNKTKILIPKPTCKWIYKKMDEIPKRGSY